MSAAADTELGEAFTTKRHWTNFGMLDPHSPTVGVSTHTFDNTNMKLMDNTACLVRQTAITERAE